MTREGQAMLKKILIGVAARPQCQIQAPFMLR